MPAITFLGDGEAETDKATYGELDRRARAVGATLGEFRGERAVLLFPPSYDYVAAFLGCLYSGVIAVPAYPPDPNRLERLLPRLRAIVADSKAKIILTTTAIHQIAEFVFHLAPELRDMRWITTDDLTHGEEHAWIEPPLGPDSVAFLQYTSGSTGTPRGVVLTHANLLHNEQMTASSLRWDGPNNGDNVSVSWLPPYHDMGLINGILFPLTYGLPCVLLPPLAFLQRPQRWLAAISKYRGTISGSPNFGFDLCVRKTTPEERASYDLRSLVTLYNGAEPIRWDTLTRFVEAFAPAGLEWHMLYPTYGLAEATLIVSGGRPGEEPVRRAVDTAALARNEVVIAEEGAPGATTLVSCGRALLDQIIAVVDPATGKLCGAGRVGEVWISGPSVAKGYFGRPEETDATFHATLGGFGGRTFLRTGDLGFIDDRDIFITGRLKDLIIVRGRNVYPQDIERAAEEAHPALRPGCSAAFAVDVDGEERVVVAVEVERRFHERRLPGAPAPAGVERRGTDRRQEDPDLPVPASPDGVFDAAAAAETVRAAIAEKAQLRVHAVAFLKPGALPKTSSGKVQRRACKQQYLEGSLQSIAVVQERPASVAPPPPEFELEKAIVQIRAWITGWLSKRLHVPAEAFDPHEPFRRWGLDSVDAVDLSDSLSKWLKRPVAPTLVLDHPTIDLAARSLITPAEPRAVRAAPAPGTAVAVEPIAIVGYACRFPGADGAEEYWRVLRDGLDVVTEVPRERWDVDAFYDPDPSAPRKMATRWGGFLRDVAGFDAPFFGISPAEAEVMDPQQRLLLEVAWEALEAAGQPAPQRLASETGVFIGASHVDYEANVDLGGTDNPYAGGGGVALSAIAGRVAFAFDFRGPALTIDTACSSSLVAIHHACQAIRAGECSMALAGGVNVILSPEVTIALSRAGMQSPDGRCRTFDARANGYVRAEGVGVVVLKTLARARADGDRVHAVILGSAVNQDGRSSALTAPNRWAQEAVIRQAYRRANVPPGDVQYVEAHGTGTSLGDPIEMMALGAVVAEARPPGMPCFVGSVKTNLGHAEAAAGIAGLLKVVLAFEHGEIPATLHFERPNPHIPFAELPLSVVAKSRPWPGPPPLVAGVSAFSFSGTNAHVLLGAPPPDRAEAPRAPKEVPPLLVPVSGNDDRALAANAAAMAERVRGRSTAELVDVAYTAAVRRTHLARRLVAIGQTGDELADELEAFARGEAADAVAGVASAERPKIAFVFTGQGSQWVGMGRGLLAAEPVFRAVIDDCDRRLRALAGWSLRELLGADEGASRLADTEIAQPAIVSIQIALAALCQSWGIYPSVVLGHSLGEISAAHVAGALPLDEALRLAVERGRLMQEATGKGSMAALSVSVDEAERIVRAHPGLAVAAVNGPESVVVSGPTEAVDAACAALPKGTAKRLHVAYAFHSAQMAPFAARLEAATAGWLLPTAGHVPFVSTSTGALHEPASLGPDYWAKQLCEPVRFRDAVGCAFDLGATVLLEIGPHATLRGDLAACAQERKIAAVVAWCGRRGSDEATTMRRAAATLFAAGCAIDWSRLAPAGKVVGLPRYAWQHERYWIERSFAPAAARAEAAASEGGDRFAIAWRSLGPAARGGDGPALRDASWILIGDGDGAGVEGGLGGALATALGAGGARVVRASARDAAAAIAGELARKGDSSPLGVIDLVPLDASAAGDTTLDVDAVEDASVLAPLGVCRALAGADRRGREVRVVHVTRGARAVDVAGSAAPLTWAGLAQSAVWGLVACFAREAPELRSVLVDLDPDRAAIAAVPALLAVAAGEVPDERLALRGGAWWAERVRPEVGSGDDARAPLRLREDACYLVTGGTGALGRAVVRWMASAGARHLVLLGRSAPTGEAARTLDELRSAGVDATWMRCDVGSLDDVRAACSRARKIAKVCGVVHAAGLVDDAPVNGVDDARARALLRPKVRGAWNLHTTTRDDDLDFFVCFSSIAGVLGSPGQAVYGAGNAFLDALAWHRRAEGLPASTIDWGPWSAGMAADPNVARKLAARGLRLIEPAAGVRQLASIMTSGATQSVAMRVDARQFLAVWQESAPPLLCELLASLRDRTDEPEPRSIRPAAVETGPLAGGAMRERLLAEPRERRAAVVVGWLGQTAGRLLRRRGPFEEPSPDASLASLGVDSLMATQLVAALRRSFAIDFPLRALFERPTLAALAAAIVDTVESSEAKDAIPRLADDAEVPLSLAQERMWFLYELEPASPTYHIAAAGRMRGDVDPATLEVAFRALLARHEPLRASFDVVDGRPVQRIAEPGAVSWSLERVDGDEREVRRWLAAWSRRPFDLRHAPLFRAVLVRLGEADHVLAVVVHHIVSDGWAMGVLLEELGATYDALARGARPDLPALPIRFRDYAAWERARVDRGALERELAFWRGELLGSPEFLELPTDRPRAASRATSPGAHVKTVLGKELSDRVNALSRELGATPYMVLVAGFAAVLAAMSGQDDVLVGSPVANRSRPESERLFGLLMNSIVLRTRVDVAESFRALVERVRDTAKRVYEHEDVPFEQLMTELRPTRSLGRTPMFQAVFVLITPKPPLRIGALPLELVDVDLGVADYDVRVDAEVKDGGVHVDLLYRADLFDEATMRAFLARYERLLAEGAARPDAPVAVSLVEPTERAALLALPEAVPMPGGEPGVEDLVVATAQDLPHRVAVRRGDESLSYRDLIVRADAVAAALARTGVRVDDRVALFVDRSIAMIVAMLGALRAGGAYVVLDPAHPDERLAWISRDVSARVVVASRALAARATAALGVTPLVVEDVCEAAAKGPRAPRPSIPPPPSNAAAYVVYTSGSTGHPKGVVVERGSLRAFVAATVRAHAMTHADKVLQFASIAWDTSVEEIFPTLATGATLVLRSDAAVDPVAFTAECTRQGVTIVNLPTAFFHELTTHVATTGAALPASLRLVVVGGERVAPDKVSLWRASSGGRARLINTYGATEATAVTVFGDLDEEHASRGEAPIGHPLAGARPYVVDDDLRLVPPGAVGELLVGGTGVARGYVERSQATAERFVPDPFSEEPGARAYRTGDRVRRLAGGALLYVGRRDAQLKVRGVRVEPAEVEAAVLGLAEVDACAVAARTDASGQRQLVAWIVPHVGTQSTPSTLRAALLKKVPDAMVPSAFVALPALPLTPSGKIDRRALPDPDWQRRTDAEYAAPRTPVEHALERAFAEVVGLERVGVHDDFFALGGHSLVAARLAGRIERALGVAVPLRLVFERPTIERLAEALSGDAASAAASASASPSASAGSASAAGMARIERAPDDAPTLLSTGQERIWFLHELEPDSPGYHIEISAALVGAPDADRLEAALRELIRRHEPLRTSFVDDDGKPRARIAADEGAWELRRLDVSLAPAHEQELRVEAAVDALAQEPFDLTRAPLLRALVAVKSPREHVVAIVMHHIVTDGWSIGVMLRDLSALYRDATGASLPALEVRYRDYVAWQRERATAGPRVAEHLAHWRSCLAGAPPAFELATDHPREAASSKGARVRVGISAATIARLEATAAADNATVFMALVASLARSLAAASGEKDLVIGTPVANRPSPELEGLVGLFMNSLPLRIDTAGCSTLRALLRRVRDVALDAYAHQDVPFEQLMEELRPPRLVGRTPLFQVVFTYQDAPQAAFDMPGVTLAVRDVRPGTADYDFVFDAQRTATGSVSVSLVYRTDLFEETSAARLLERFAQNVEALVAAPDAPLDTAILTPEERRWLFEKWQPEPVTAVVASRASTVVDSIAETVLVHADRLALVDGREKLTYAELDACAGRLARHLRSMGAGAESRVAVLVERSTAYVTTVCGVLRAGAAYVPLDPQHPNERLATMVEAAGVEIIVAQSALARRVTRLGCRVVELETLDGGDATVSAGPGPGASASLPRAIPPQSLAYVMFTSGSTGTPNAVAVQHRSLASYVQSAISTFSMSEEDRVCQFASIGWDTSVEEIFPSLAIGACVVLRTDEMVVPSAFLREVRRQQISIVNVPTAFFHELVAHIIDDGAALPSTLRLVIIGGERVLEEKVDAWTRAVGRDVALVNTYGATETTAVTAFGRLPDPPGVPIGGLLPGVRAYVLDEGLRPVPIGAPGELCVGGTAPARGYLGRRELTAERFVPDPFAGRGARMYRTGDTCRFRPDGRIEYVGRRDHQVKIRGVRIEPAEVEAALSRIPGIRSAAVVAHEQSPGEVRLTAYVVPRPGEPPPNPQNVRRALGRALPDAMVPTSVIALDALPLLANGKLDRAALPSPTGRGEVETPYVAPRNPLEQRLVDIVAEVLHVERVGVDDNFFALGGHSITATQVIARVRRQVGVELPLRTIFDHPTVALLAGAVASSSADRGPVSSVPTSRSRASQRLTLTPDDEIVPSVRKGSNKA